MHFCRVMDIHTLNPIPHYRLKSMYLRYDLANYMPHFSPKKILPPLKHRPMGLYQRNRKIYWQSLLQMNFPNELSWEHLINIILSIIHQIWIHTLQSGIDVPPWLIFFQKMHAITFLLQPPPPPPPRLLNLSIDEIVRPRHNSNAIDLVIACVNVWCCQS